MILSKKGLKSLTEDDLLRIIGAINRAQLIIPKDRIDMLWAVDRILVDCLEEILRRNGVGNETPHERMAGSA